MKVVQSIQLDVPDASLARTQHYVSSTLRKSRSHFEIEDSKPHSMSNT